MPFETEDWASSLRLAQSLADVAADVALRYFRQGNLGQWHKPDGSRVTEADLACESAIRRVLAVEAPAESMLGEETGGGEGSGDRWIIDPIDGTENFSRGNPVWATLIAKEVAGRISVAVISAPALGRRWWATSGGGAFTGGGQRLEVSAAADRSLGTFAYGGLHEVPSQQALDKVLAAARGFRCAWGWGNFWGHVLVAEGVADAALSYGIEPWDIAAPALLVAEAGGEWSDVDGRQRIAPGSFLTSNGLLHADLVTDLGEPPSGPNAY